MMDIVYTIIIFIMGFAFPGLLRKNLDKKDILSLRLLWLFHIVLATTYYFYTRNGGGDAWGYWNISRDISENDFYNYIVGKGTFVIYAINYIPANILEMGYFSNTMLYALYGFIGILFFYKISIELISYNIKYKVFYLFPLLFFLPNLHFWSSGIGKDSLLFLCVGMVSYGMVSIRKRLLLIIIGSVLSFAIRPHITLFLTISYGTAYLFSKKVSKGQRTLFSVLLLGVVVAISPIVMQYAKIEEASFDNLESFSNDKVESLSGVGTGSSVNISSYPYPLKILTFLYRPFFFDINGIPSVIASFENLLLLVLSIAVLRNNPIRVFKDAPLVIQALLIFLVIGILAFSMILGNLGIMLRMRNMFLPGMIIFILWSFSYNYQIKKE